MSVPDIVFVLGPPGAGKGTQCTNIKEKFGYIHLSAGDLLRAERAAGSADGELIEDCIKNGLIVPAEITIRLLEKAITSQGSTKVLIDGFPRDKSNLDAWERMMVDTGKMNTKFMLLFDCEEEECLRRALGRNQNRSDDNVESFKKRISTYNSSTKVVVEEFRSRGLIRTINSNSTPDGVFQDVQKLFLLEGNSPLLTEMLMTTAPLAELHTELHATTIQPLAELPATTIQPLAELHATTIQPLDSIAAPQLPIEVGEPAVVETTSTVVLSLGGSADSQSGYGGIFSLCALL